MSKHTPGPWWIEVEETETRIESKLQTICENVSNCDAPLIAAAPELLAMLEEIVNRATRPKKDDCGYEVVSIRNLLLDKARASIAKAKGE
jgi:hypothetical protein